MKRARIRDPYAEFVDRFNRIGVKYVIVGMSAINYYASNAAETFSTMDFDIFVKPTIGNVKKAAGVLTELGYSLAVKDEVLAESLINKVVARRNTIVATDPYGIMIELILAVSGYRFDQMESDAAIFMIENIPFKVGKLRKLLQSKKIAARDKDKHFLKRYEMLLKEKAEG